MGSSLGTRRLRTKSGSRKGTQGRSKGYRGAPGGSRGPESEGLGRLQLSLELPDLGLKRFLDGHAFLAQVRRLLLPAHAASFERDRPPGGPPLVTPQLNGGQ